VRYSRLRSRRRALASEINVVPYIDVMLVLLVIFMITAPLLHQGVQVQLPNASAKAVPPSSTRPMVVTLTHDGKIYFSHALNSRKALTMQTLLTNVAANVRLRRQAKGDTTIYVRADSHVNYGDVVNVMAAMQQVGASEIGLLTEPKAKHYV